MTTKPVKITIYARIGDSDVLNVLGSVEREMEFQAITPENRRPADAPGATMRIFDTGLPDTLRQIADQIEQR